MHVCDVCVYMHSCMCVCVRACVCIVIVYSVIAPIYTGSYHYCSHCLVTVRCSQLMLIRSGQ